MSARQCLTVFVDSYCTRPSFVPFPHLLALAHPAAGRRRPTPAQRTEVLITPAIPFFRFPLTHSSLRVRTQRLEGSTVAASSGQILDRLVLHQAMQEYAEVRVY